MSKVSDLRGKTPAELREHLEELLKTQFSLRMQKGVGQLTQTHLMKTVRRDIARVRTLLNEKAGDQA